MTLTYDYTGEAFDAVVVLHARKGAASLRTFTRRYPGRPSVLALTGTDLYHDIATSAAAQRSLQLASRLLVLQSEGIAALPRGVRAKARVIYQSVALPGYYARAASKHCRVLFVGGLRVIKDPFRVAYAVRTLPQASGIRVLAIGPAYSGWYESRARAEMLRNPRYRWRGEAPHARVLRAIEQSDVVVVSSRNEGGANVIAEAIVAGVPLLASDMPGNRGMLGADYGGYFPVGDTVRLRDLLVRAETERAFVARLRTQCRERAKLFTPQRERAAWKALLSEILPKRAFD